MADWAQVQDYGNVVISTGGLEGIGTQLFQTGGGLNAGVQTWPAANRALYIPVIVPTTVTVVKMFMLNGATINGNFDVGIYDDQKNLIVSKGSTAHASANVIQAFDITDTTLSPGVYYFGIASDSATATIQAFTNAIPLCQASGVLSQATAFPLPSPAVWVAAQDAYVPIVRATLRTVV